MDQWTANHQWSRSAILIILDDAARDHHAALDLPLKDYFEDEHLSGGGKLQAAVGFINPYNAIVCFSEPETKDRVLQKQYHHMQTENGRKLQLFVTECPLQLKRKMAIRPATQTGTSALTHEGSTDDFATTTTPKWDDEDVKPLHTTTAAASVREDEEKEEEKDEDGEEEGETNNVNKLDREKQSVTVEDSADKEERTVIVEGAAEKEERTVVVKGLDGDVTPDVLDQVFTDAAGSDDLVETISIDGSDGTAAVVLSSKEDVDRVFKELATRPRNVSGRTLKVTGGRSLALSPNDPDPGPEVLHDRRTIVVTGVEPHLSQKYLELFFKKKEKSGGGPIENVGIDRSCGSCRITFKDQKDAEEVISKGPHRLSNCNLKVHVSAGFSPSRPIGIKEPGVDTNHRGERTECHKDSSLFAAKECTPEDQDPVLPVVEVHAVGLTQEIGEEWLRTFFSEKGLSGGGKIKELRYDKGTDHAFLTYEDEEVAERVLTHRTLEVGEAVLTLSRAPPNGQQPAKHISEEADPEVQERTVRIIGLDSTLYKLTNVKGLFENEKITGGGPIHDINYEGDTGDIVVCFKNSADAHRVLQKAKIYMGKQVLRVAPFQRSMFDEGHEH